MPITQDIRVPFRYGIHFTNGVFDRSNPLLRQILAGSDRLPADVVAVVDSGVARAHPALTKQIAEYADENATTLALAKPVLVLPGGEVCKNDPTHLEAVHQLIHGAGLCRHSYVLAVGGGALLDVVGYAAATAHRGIRLVRVPTTVLSQDDSAVGVKNGVNGFSKKNYFGTFAPPFAVLNDLDFLATLEDRDWLGGVSEAIKVALIRDPGFFEYLEMHARDLVRRDAAVMEEVVRRSAALHAAHIQSGDPFELGSSRPLDYGHWAAHKLESLTDYRLRHGEAVAVGIALDSTYAHLSGMLPASDWRRIIDVILALRLPLFVSELAESVETPSHAKSVLRGLEEFREHLGGTLTVMLLEGIGRPVDVHEIDIERMQRSVRRLREIAEERSLPAQPDFGRAPAI